MNFNEYQTETTKTALYPGDQGLTYTALGLAGETGEYVDKVKKVLRGDYVLDFEHKLRLALELGDVLWYLSRCAAEIGYDLQEIASLNLDKLASRRQRGTIKGSGDSR